MTSPPGAEDALLGALNDHERAALADWADDGDVPDGFEDRVVAAYLGRGERQGEGDSDAGGAEAAVARSRAAASEGRVVRLVGWAAAIAAAAAVMLMVRVLPRASEVELVAEAQSEAGEPSRSVEPPRAETSSPSPEPALVVLGAAAGSVLAQHCSPCHDSTDPERKPAALDVFDLEEPQWWLTMSDAQLEEARMRVQELGAASDDERRTMDAFVEARLHPTAHAG